MQKVFKEFNERNLEHDPVEDEHRETCKMFRS